MEYGYCNICKKHLYSYSDYVLKGGKKICIDCNAKAQANSPKEYNELLGYIKKLFHKENVPESWLIYIDKLKNQGRSYSGIRGTLYYYYEILKKVVPYDSQSAIGIVDFVYEEAFDFFQKLEEVNEYNRTARCETKTNVVKTSTKELGESTIDIGEL